MGSIMVNDAPTGDNGSNTDASSIRLTRTYADAFARALGDAIALAELKRIADRAANGNGATIISTEPVSVPSLSGTFDADAFAKRNASLERLSRALALKSRERLDALAQRLGFSDIDTFLAASDAAERIIAPAYAEHFTDELARDDSFSERLAGIARARKRAADAFAALCRGFASILCTKSDS